MSVLPLCISLLMTSELVCSAQAGMLDWVLAALRGTHGWCQLKDGGRACQVPDLHRQRAVTSAAQDVAVLRKTCASEVSTGVSCAADVSRAGWTAKALWPVKEAQHVFLVHQN